VAGEEVGDARLSAALRADDQHFGADRVHWRGRQPAATQRAVSVPLRWVLHTIADQHAKEVNFSIKIEITMDSGVAARIPL
jgi:hypothetical protein